MSASNLVKNFLCLNIVVFMASMAGLWAFGSSDSGRNEEDVFRTETFEVLVKVADVAPPRMDEIPQLPRAFRAAPARIMPEKISEDGLFSDLGYLRASAGQSKTPVKAPARHPDRNTLHYLGQEFSMFFDEQRSMILLDRFADQRGDLVSYPFSGHSYRVGQHSEFCGYLIRSGSDFFLGSEDALSDQAYAELLDAKFHGFPYQRDIEGSAELEAWVICRGGRLDGFAPFKTEMLAVELSGFALGRPTRVGADHE